VGTWALLEPRPHNRVGDVQLQATAAGSGFRLDGTKTLVEGGGQADLFLVAARTDGGLVQLLVPADTPGVTVTPLHGLDLTRRFSEVTFAGTEMPASAVVGPAGAADADIEALLRVAIVLQVAEMVGAMDRALEMTVEWAFDRYTFGRPLASYQALKHRFADMKTWLEASHALSDAATQAVNDDAPNAAELASAAKAYVSEYGPELVQDCVQMHGGIGVTFDHDLHLYLRRVVVGAVNYGTVAEHRERLTTILEQQEAVA
jgi:alkylation response protein AidB-like acyl-CoA dehydrogenase